MNVDGACIAPGAALETNNCGLGPRREGNRPEAVALMLNVPYEGRRAVVAGK